MIPVNKVITPDQERLFDLYSEILSSGKVTNNASFVRKLESEIGQRLDNTRAIAVSNGTIALHLAIRALEKKGEIITTPFSCVASSSAIVWEGCKPVYCDIDPGTLCIDPDKIEALITENTVAILAVHVFGNLCNIDAIEAIARKYSIATIYDGAQAYGATYKGRSAFSYGDYSTLSLHAYKIVSSVEGGVVFTRTQSSHEHLYRLRYFGKDTNNFEITLGTNAKMNEFNAAFGLLSMENAEAEIEARKKIADFYDRRFKTNAALALQQKTDGAEPNYSYYCVILPDAAALDRVVKSGEETGIGYRRYFYPSLNTLAFLSEEYRHMPVSEDVADRIICLPVYSGLNEAELEKITNHILHNV